jgi:hypothetical protein
MPVVLSPVIHEEIYERVRNAFVDFSLFDQLVSNQLKKAIADSNTIDIDVKTTRKLIDKYFDAESFKTEQQKLLLTQIQLILRTTYVVILSYHENVQAQLWCDIPTLLDHYPQFQGQEEEELKYLLTFRNMVKVALMIIPARLNKQLLLKIAARLEGSRTEYITGGGQKPCVTRRVEIYEQEGNIRPERRQDRIRPPRIPGKKRQGVGSLKDLKMVRLASEEIRNLTKGPSDHPVKKHHHQQHSNNSSNGQGQSSGSSGTTKNSSNGVDSHNAASGPFHFGELLPNGTILPNGATIQTINGINYQLVPFPADISALYGPPLTSANSFAPPPEDPIVAESLDDLLAYYNPVASGATIAGMMPQGGIMMGIPGMGMPMVAGGGGMENVFWIANPPIYSLPMNFAQVNNNSGSGGGNIAASSESKSSKEESYGGNKGQGASSSGANNCTLPSSTFPPVLSREQSELIDKLLLPLDGSDAFWTSGIGVSASGNSSGGAVGGGSGGALATGDTHPLEMMRNISWDIYNGSFADDLKNIFGEW